jgi:4'-phosphopantetheinyl transferase
VQGCHDQGVETGRDSIVAVTWVKPSADPRLESLLDRTERDRADAMLRAEDRTRFVTAHALLRLVVAAETGCPPAELRIAAHCRRCGGRHGKPTIVGMPIEFSLSHSADRVVIALDSHRQVGVDVERIDATDFPGFAEVALAAGERASSLADRAVVWARKEAVLKATGHGLDIPPTALTVSGADQPPQLLAWNADDKPTMPVHLADLPLGQGYAGALAVLGGEPPTVRVVSGAPLLTSWEMPVARDRTTRH